MPPVWEWKRPLGDFVPKVAIVRERPVAPVFSQGFWLVQLLANRPRCRYLETNTHRGKNLGLNDPPNCLCQSHATSLSIIINLLHDDLETAGMLTA